MHHAHSETTGVSSEDEKPWNIYVNSGEFYMNLEDELSLTKNEEDKTRFIVIYKDKVVGVMRDPGTQIDADRITVEELREHFHEILESFSHEDKGFAITVDGEPAGYFSSKSLYSKELREARDFLIKHVKKQEREVKKTRSWFSRLFNRKTDLE